MNDFTFYQLACALFTDVCPKVIEDAMPEDEDEAREFVRTLAGKYYDRQEELLLRMAMKPDDPRAALSWEGFQDVIHYGDRAYSTNKYIAARLPGSRTGERMSDYRMEVLDYSATLLTNPAVTQIEEPIQNLHCSADQICAHMNISPVRFQQGLDFMSEIFPPDQEIDLIWVTHYRIILEKWPAYVTIIRGGS